MRVRLGRQGLEDAPRIAAREELPPLRDDRVSVHPSIPDTVREFRLTDPADRQRRLQALIGPKTNDSSLLHWRALLMTALTEAELWPPRKKL